VEKTAAARCGSLETKRNSKTHSVPTRRAAPIKPLQRFLCSVCGTTFSFERKTARPRARLRSLAVARHAQRLGARARSARQDAA
jgi:transposase-like protein